MYIMHIALPISYGRCINGHLNIVIDGNGLWQIGGLISSYFWSENFSLLITKYTRHAFFYVHIHYWLFCRRIPVGKNARSIPVRKAHSAFRLLLYPAQVLYRIIYFPNEKAWRGILCGGNQMWLKSPVVLWWPLGACTHSRAKPRLRYHPLPTEQLHMRLFVMESASL